MEARRSFAPLPSVTSLVVARRAPAVALVRVLLAALLPITSSLIVALVFSPSVTAIRVTSASPCAGDSTLITIGAAITPRANVI